MSVYGLSARIVLLLGTLTVSLFTSSASYAVMTVVIEEQGADVVMSASGTINLNGLGSVTNGTCNSGINAFTGLAVAGGSNVPCDFYAIPSPTPSPRAGFGGAWPIARIERTWLECPLCEEQMFTAIPSDSRFRPISVINASHQPAVRGTSIG
jgi:hypothetical protein